MRENIEAIRVVLKEHAKNETARTSERPSLRNFVVVVFLKKAERFENAKAELFSIARNHLYELYEQGDSVVFSFGFGTRSEAEACF